MYTHKNTYTDTTRIAQYGENYSGTPKRGNHLLKPTDNILLCRHTSDYSWKLYGQLEFKTFQYI